MMIMAWIKWSCVWSILSSLIVCAWSVWSSLIVRARSVWRTWSAGRIDAVLVISLKTGRTRQRSVIVVVGVKVISFVVRNDRTAKMSGRITGFNVDATGEDLMARGAAQEDSNVGLGGE